MPGVEYGVDNDEPVHKSPILSWLQRGQLLAASSMKSQHTPCGLLQCTWDLLVPQVISITARSRLNLELENGWSRRTHTWTSFFR